MPELSQDFIENQEHLVELRIRRLVYVDIAWTIVYFVIGFATAWWVYK